MHQSGKNKRLIALVAVLLLAVPLCRFTWVERGYLKEVRLMMDSTRFWASPVQHSPEDTATLGPYYLSLQGPYALRYGYEKWEVSPLETPNVLPEEDRVLSTPWTPPLVFYANGAHVNPITVTQVGLADYTRYLYTGDARFLQAIYEAADWLVENQSQDGGWPHDFQHRDLQPGWISGMGQGQAASLLLRAYQESGDSRYLETATRGIHLMLMPIADGGTLGSLPNESPILEEYPASHRVPHVLNGALFALFGLWDYAIVADDKVAMEQFELLSDSIAQSIDKWDTGSWTRYGLTEEYGTATAPYHMVHIAQTSVMYDLTNDPVWERTTAKWVGYAESRQAHGTLRHGLSEFFLRLKNRLIFSAWWPWGQAANEIDDAASIGAPELPHA